MAIATRMSVCLLATTVNHAKTAELIKVRFGVLTRLGQSNQALDGRALWRRLTNTTERSVCSADAISC